MANLRDKLNIREALFYMLISLNLYEKIDNEVVDTKVLYFDVEDNVKLLSASHYLGTVIRNLKIEEYLNPMASAYCYLRKEEIDVPVYVC